MALDKSKPTQVANNNDIQMPRIVPPMIVRVFDDGVPTDVPVTPETTCSDVIECCRDPGEESCDLVAVCPEHGECPLQNNDHPLEILQRWGSGRLVLRYTVLSANGGTYEKRNGMKEPDHFGETLPDGVQLTLNELREMACRQQSQIDSQHQLLAAKEQRLRYLKEQEAHQQRVQAESERLRRLRERVDAQEMKLRKLRAIRGQVDHQKQNNISLTSDLDSIRALFNEKEKELSLAVAKVEELTRQLEELRRGRSARDQPPASALELDKLRRELMYRNKLNEQQNHRLNQQREALTARQEEMSAIDKRISELQERLHRKRLLNQQLANQISAASHKAAYHQLVRLTSGSVDQTNQSYGARKAPQSGVQPPNGLSRNIAAVEPYNHVPVPNGHQNRTSHGNQDNSTYHPVYQQNHHIKSDSDQLHNQENQPDLTNKMSNMYIARNEDTDMLKDFSVSKSDPKYQTLPYNTKFTVNLIPSRMSSNNRTGQVESSDNNNVNVNNNNLENKEVSDPNLQLQQQNISSNANLANGTNHSGNSQSQQQYTVHSAPLSVINKNIATPLNQNDLLNRKMENGMVKMSSENNVQNANYQKPVSSVAPTSVHHSGKLSNIYQTSSIKVQPVEPQTISTQKQPAQPPSTSYNSTSTPGYPQAATTTTTGYNNTATYNQAYNQSSFIPSTTSYIPPTTSYNPATTTIPAPANYIPSVTYNSPLNPLSSPQSTSTPLNTPEVSSSDKTPKPALPPKPAIKPPPRQTSANENELVPPPLPSSEPPDDSKPPPIVQQKPKPGTSLSQPLQTPLSQKGYVAPPTSTSNQPLTPASTTLTPSSNNSTDNMPIIKAKPLTIKKQPLSEQPKLRSLSSYSKLNGLSINKRRVEIPSAFNFTEEKSGGDILNGGSPQQQNFSQQNFGQQGQQHSPLNHIQQQQHSPLNHLNQQQNFGQQPVLGHQGLGHQSVGQQGLSQQGLSQQGLGQQGVGQQILGQQGTGHQGLGHQTLSQQILGQPTLGSQQTIGGQLLTQQSFLQQNFSGNLLLGNTQQESPKESPTGKSPDESDRAPAPDDCDQLSKDSSDSSSKLSDLITESVVRRCKKGNLKQTGKTNLARRVSFDPLALLLDASLEGELELVKKTATQVPNPSAANDEGITALHNAICAGHLEIVKFLVEFGCDVNAQDSDGWTPLHCAASCNNLAMVKFLVEHGACIFATTLSDHETAAEKCEEDEEGFDGCSEYLYSVQEKLGILSGGVVYSVFDYTAQQADELSFKAGQQLTILRKGDESEREWWWSRLGDTEGYVPRNLLGLYPRVSRSEE